MPAEWGEEPGPAQDGPGPEGLHMTQIVVGFAPLKRDPAALHEVKAVGWLALLEDRLSGLDCLLGHVAADEFDRLIGQTLQEGMLGEVRGQRSEEHTSELPSRF